MSIRQALVEKEQRQRRIFFSRKMTKEQQNVL